MEYQYNLLFIFIILQFQKFKENQLKDFNYLIIYIFKYYQSIIQLKLKYIVFVLKISICQEKSSTYEKVSDSDQEIPKTIYSKEYKEFSDEIDQKEFKQFVDNDKIKIPQLNEQKKQKEKKQYKAVIIQKACLLLLVFLISTIFLVIQLTTCQLSSKYHQVIYGAQSTQPFRLSSVKYSSQSVNSYFNQNADRYININNQQQYKQIKQYLIVQEEQNTTDIISQRFNFSVLVNNTGNNNNYIEQIYFTNSTDNNFNITTYNIAKKQVYIDYPSFTYQTSVPKDTENINGRSLWVVDMKQLSAGKWNGDICNCQYQLYFNSRQDNISITPFTIRDIRGNISFSNWTYYGQLILDNNIQNQYISFNGLNQVQEIYIPKTYESITLDFTQTEATNATFVFPSNKDCVMNQSLSSFDSENICQLCLQGMVNEQYKLDYVQPIVYSNNFTIHINTSWSFETNVTEIFGNKQYTIYNGFITIITFKFQDIQGFDCSFANQNLRSIDLICNE